jgi:hypothetical protein
MSEYQFVTKRVRQVHEYQGSWSRIFDIDTEESVLDYTDMEGYVDYRIALVVEPLREQLAQEDE